MRVKASSKIFVHIFMLKFFSTYDKINTSPYILKVLTSFLKLLSLLCVIFRITFHGDFEQEQVA